MRWFGKTVGFKNLLKESSLARKTYLSG